MATLTETGTRTTEKPWPPVFLMDCGGIESKLAELDEKDGHSEFEQRTKALKRLAESAFWVQWARQDLRSLLGDSTLWARRKLRRAWLEHRAGADRADIDPNIMGKAAKMDPIRMLSEKGKTIFAHWLEAGEKFQKLMLQGRKPQEIADKLAVKDLVGLFDCGWLAKAPPQSLRDALKPNPFLGKVYTDLGDRLADGWVS